MALLRYLEETEAFDNFMDLSHLKLFSKCLNNPKLFFKCLNNHVSPLFSVLHFRHQISSRVNAPAFISGDCLGPVYKIWFD